MRVFLLLLLGLAAASCGPSRHDVPNSRASTNVPAFGDTDPHEWDALSPWLYPIHGIDVSKYQGEIDWQRVRASGTSFAFIKATEGGDVADERFLDNGLQGRRHVIMFLRQPIFWPARLAELLDKGRAEHPGTFVETEVSVVDKKAAIGPYPDDLPEFIRISRLAVGRHAHHFPLVHVRPEPEISGNGRVQKPQGMRVTHLFFDRYPAAPAMTACHGRPLAKTVGRQYRRLLKRRHQKSAGGVRKVVFHEQRLSLVSHLPLEDQGEYQPLLKPVRHSFQKISK